MKLKFYLFMASMAFILQACEKTEYVKSNPQLEITVVRDNIIFVEEATVSIYDTQEDWQSKSNIILSLKTDSKGKVLFKDLKEQKYYFFVEKDELDNVADIAATWEPLKSGQKSEVLVKIMNTNL